MQVQHLLNQFSSDWFITADEGQVYFRGMISEADDSVSYKTSLKQHCKPATRFSLEPNLVLFWYGNRKTGTGNQYVNLFFFFFFPCVLYWQLQYVSFPALEMEEDHFFWALCSFYACFFLWQERKNMATLITLYLLTAILANVFLDANLLKEDRKTTSST